MSRSGIAWIKFGEYRNLGRQHGQHGICIADTNLSGTAETNWLLRRTWGTEQFKHPIGRMFNRVVSEWYGRPVPTLAFITKVELRQYGATPARTIHSSAHGHKQPRERAAISQFKNLQKQRFALE